VLVVGRSVNDFTEAMPRYQVRLQDLIRSTTTVATDLGVPLEDVGAFGLLPTGVFNIVGTTLGALAAVASNSLLVLLTVIFILFEAAGFHTKLKIAFGADADFGELRLMTQQVQHYLVIKTAISAATGVIIGTWVWAWGLDFPLLWGLVAFILNFIPNFGSIIAAVPAVLLAVISSAPVGRPSSRWAISW
jgi:AI-2 transport protein TqsA